MNGSTKEERPAEQTFLFNVDEEMLELTKKKSMEFRRLMTYYKCAIREVETKFHVLDEEYSLLNDRNPISVIKSRLKSAPSIIDKLHRKHVTISLPEIERQLSDVAGIRVICSFVQDVYKLADALLAQDDITLIEKKDYIQHPKPNGYRSLHLIVEVPIFLEKEKKQIKVEIQLRTIAMDCWASLEHQLRYKKGTQFTEDMQNSLLTCAKICIDLDDQMDMLRKESNI